jgi:hypothetical protein
VIARLSYAMSGAKGVSQVRAKGSSRVIARLSYAMSGARGVSHVRTKASAE